MRWAWMVAVIAGCEAEAEKQQQQGSPTEPQGQVTEGGAGTTTPGSAGGGVAYRWYDQTGEAVTEGPDLVVWSEEGHLWQLDWESGEGAPVRLYTILFETPDCSGTEYLQSPLPMVVHDDGRGAFIRDPEQPSVMIEAMAASSDDFSCGVGFGEHVVIDAAGVERISYAPPRFAGPLYPGP